MPITYKYTNIGVLFYIIPLVHVLIIKTIKLNDDLRLMEILKKEENCL
ncbi:MAG: hypothetical protein ACJAX4_004867 [Clostridium sp.]|jgi:hypothetical protein